MHSTITGGPPNFACTTDPLDDLDRLLSNSAEFTEFLTAPTLPSIQSQRKALQGSIDNCVGRASNIQQDAAPDGRKQRALDKSREAQKRFRQRQKARLDTIQSQLDETTKQLRDLRVQQQQLQTRNILLEKMAQLSKDQTTDDYLAWQSKQAVLDFSCGHTEETPQGFTLTLTIFGHAESKECRTVSNMSLSELAALWTEYMRKLGKCLLSLQQDQDGGARPLLNLWVAEAIALICCVRVYNPEFLKAIDSTAMNGSAVARPSQPLLMQHLELLEFTADQVHDTMYLRRIVAARAHDLERQRHEASDRMLSQASSKQHPSDHLAASKDAAEKLKAIGIEEYKLHGIATDALFNGIFTSSQNAMGLVHMYPFLPDPLEYLELIAEQQGLKNAPLDTPDSITKADWKILLAYCSKITAVDYFDYVPLRGFQAPPPQAMAQAPINPNTQSPRHVAAAMNSDSFIAQTPSPGQRSVHFSPEPVFRQASFHTSHSHSLSHSHSHSPEHVTPSQSQSPAQRGQQSRNQAPALSLQAQSEAMRLSEIQRQASWQGSSQMREGPAPAQSPTWFSQSQPAQYAPLQASNPTHATFQNSQQQMPCRDLLQIQGEMPSQAAQDMEIGQLQNAHHANFQSGRQQTPGRSFPQAQNQMLDQIGHQQRFGHVGISNITEVGQGHQGQLNQSHRPDTPTWLGQNLASTYAVPPPQSKPFSQPQNPGHYVSQVSQASDPKVIYPTAAMRSQQLSSNAAPTGNKVQASLAPF